MPINDPNLDALIKNNTLDQILVGADVTPAIGDLQPAAEELFAKYNADVRNDPVRQGEHRLQNYTVTVNGTQVTNQVRTITFDGKTLRFTTATKGTRPATGYPLYISLHGGGYGSPGVNDEQWINQMDLWKGPVRRGLYVTPRGIADAGEMHYLPQSYVMYDRIIENLIAFEDVDPNKVYVLGFSAGGDGVYQMTAEMSDRFAATNMMAGHPNGVSTTNYRNVPFLIQMGENDTAFNRNREAARYHELLNIAAQTYGGYEHQTFIHPNGDHNNWIPASNSRTPQPHPVIKDPVLWLQNNDRTTVDENTDSVVWLRTRTRNSLPERVLWNIKTRARSRTGIDSRGQRFWKSDARARQFYWLDLGADQSKYGDVDASYDRANNSITLNRCGDYLRVLLHPQMLDLTRPVQILLGADRWLVSPRLSLRTMVQTLFDRGDINYVFPAAVEVRKTASGAYRVDGGVKVNGQPQSAYLAAVAYDLMGQCPSQIGIWNYGTNNTLPRDWLLATPFNALGTRYDELKEAVPGDYPLFGLSSGNATRPHEQSVPVQATVTRPGATPAQLLEGHSYKLYDEIYSIITGATVFVDLTTLTLPTGRFLAAIADALTYISNKPDTQRPIVRLLYSNWLTGNDDIPSAGSFLAKLLQGVDPAQKLEVYAGAINTGLDKGVSAWASSWNHTKIVAADGRAALVGGHNLWSEQYLDKNPVFDVSLKLQGESACHAQDYADELWRYVLWRMNESLFDQVQREAGVLPIVNTAAYTYEAASSSGRIKEAYTRKADTKPAVILYNPAGQPDPQLYTRAKAQFAPQTGSIPILSAGRGAGLDHSDVFTNRDSYLSPTPEPADESLYRLLSKAQNTLRMSVQTFNLTPTSPAVERLVVSWDYRLLRELARALNRGVTIQVVLSNPGAMAGGLERSATPYDGDELASVNKRLADLLVTDCYLTPDQASALLARKLSVASLRFSADEGYPDGHGGRTIAFPNHAKTLMVDDRVFYVGSQDPYRSNTATFGYLIEDTALAQSYITSYWAELWNQSKRTATQSAESSLVKTQNAAATVFILDLLDNQRLSATWQAAVDHYTNAAVDAQVPFLATLNDIIANAGYDTTAAAVIELTQTPFFTHTRPNSPATDESDRFVKDLLTRKDLLIPFAALIDSIDGSAADSDAAVNRFLADRKYDCTVLQIYASFAGLRGGNLNYYKGAYTGAVVTDGGKAFDFNAPQASPTLAWHTATTGPIQPGPGLVIETDQSIKLDGIALAKPTYCNNLLTWSKADGNPTSGSLTFSEVPRSGLKDSFCGVECFGQIEYPDSAAPPLQGKLSFYARRQADRNTPPQPGAPVGGPVVWPILVSVLLALVLGFAILGALYRSRDRANRRDRDADKDKYEKLVSERDPENTDAFELVEKNADHELRRRSGKEKVDAANAEHQGGWAEKTLRGELKADVDHYVSEAGANVDPDNLRSSLEKGLADRVEQILNENDYLEESSRTADELLDNSEFMREIRENATAAYRDQILQSVTRSLIDRYGETTYKKRISEHVGDYLDLSVARRLANPLVSRMNRPLQGESYLHNVLTAQIATLKTEYLKSPDNKAALQSAVGGQLESILGDQTKTASEITDSRKSLTQAESDYERTKSATDEQRVDQLTGQLEEMEDHEKQLEEDRREAENRRNELDADKLDEKRKREDKKAEDKRHDVFRPSDLVV